MPLVEARAFDDESRPTAFALTFAPYAAGMTRVMDGITSKLGWGRLNFNVGPGAGDVRQSWVTAVREWEGRFSTAANGVVLDPDAPRLELAELTCPEAISIGPGWEVGWTVIGSHQDRRPLCTSIIVCGYTTAGVALCAGHY